MQLHQAIVITPQLRATLDEARTALARRVDIDRAVTANQEALRTTFSGLEEMKANVSAFDAAAIHAEAAASMDPSKKPEVAKAVKAADLAAAELVKRQRDIERRTAAQEVLNDSARAADEAIAAMRSRVAGAVKEVDMLLREAYAADLAEACKPLAGVLQAAREIHNALPGGFCRHLLENTKVLDPRSFRVVATDAYSNVSGTDLLLGSHPSVEMPSDAQRALREISEVLKALAEHRPFVPPAKTAVTKPYRVQSLPVTEQQRIKAARAKEPNWSPPPSAWLSGCEPKNNGTSGSTQSPTNELDVSAAASGLSAVGDRD